MSFIAFVIVFVIAAFIVFVLCWNVRLVRVRNHVRSKWKVKRRRKEEGGREVYCND